MVDKCRFKCTSNLNLHLNLYVFIWFIKRTNCLSTDGAQGQVQTQMQTQVQIALELALEFALEFGAFLLKSICLLNKTMMFFEKDQKT